MTTTSKETAVHLDTSAIRARKLDLVVAAGEWCDVSAQVLGSRAHGGAATIASQSAIVL